MLYFADDQAILIEDNISDMLQNVAETGNENKCIKNKGYSRIRGQYVDLGKYVDLGTYLEQYLIVIADNQ